MDINGVRNFLNVVDAESLDSIELKLVEKNDGQVQVYTPQLSLEMRRNIRDLYVEILNNNFFELDQRAYDPTLVVEGTLQFSDLNTAHINVTLEGIENADFNGDLNEVDLNSINYYVVKFTSRDNRNLFVFRRFTKMKKIRNGIFGLIRDNEFHGIETNYFFGIDRDIDIVVFENEALIINRFALQTIFNLNDYFNQQAEIALSRIKDRNIISNFDIFYNDCINDKLASRRMTKILNTDGRLQGFFDNINQLPLVVEQFNLELEINNGIINYLGTKESRNNILGCIADAYYQSLIQLRYGEAD